ncbi:MAG: TonB family protein [Proteobacteria bacterium]|nr:TonB family protein [Pseudomonadota bacterium]
MSIAFESSFDRRSWATGRWASAAVVVVGLHVGGAAAGFLSWDRQPEEMLLPPPMLIAFELAPAPVAPPAPPKVEEMTEIEPAPELPPLSELDLAPPAPPEVKVAVAVPEKPKPVQKKKRKEPEKKKKIEKKPIETPQPPQPIATPQPATASTAAPAPPNLPSASVAAAPKSSMDPQAAFATAQWHQLFNEHIKKYRKYPKSARRKHLEGSPTVAFVFDRAGNVMSAEILRSSGIAALDEEAIATFQRADPLPALPPEIAGDTKRMTLRIDFKLN